MTKDLYHEYIYVIGKLKDIYNLHVDVDHKNIHTFYKDKKPLFKLFYGMFSKEDDYSIVVSFHLDLLHIEVIQWFYNIYAIHPLLRIHDSYIEDSNGEYYLGEDALALKELYEAQKVLSHWLENYDKEDIEAFVSAKVTGRERTPNQQFNVDVQKEDAIAEFDRIKKPDEDESVH